MSSCSYNNIGEIREELHGLQVSMARSTLDYTLLQSSVRGKLGLLSVDSGYATLEEVNAFPGLLGLRIAARTTLLLDAETQYTHLPPEQQNHLDRLTSAHITAAGEECASYNREDRKHEEPGLGLQRIQDGLATFADSTVALIRTSLLMLPDKTPETRYKLALTGVGLVATTMGLQLPDFENFLLRHSMVSEHDKTQYLPPAIFEALDPENPELRLKSGTIRALLGTPPPLGRKRQSLSGGSKRCPGLKVDASTFSGVAKIILDAGRKSGKFDQEPFSH